MILYARFHDLTLKIYMKILSFARCCIVQNWTTCHSQVTLCHCQVIAGQLQTAQLPQGQLTTGRQRESRDGKQASGWAECRAAGKQAAVTRVFPFSQPPAMPGYEQKRLGITVAAAGVGSREVAEARGFPFSYTRPPRQALSLVCHR